MIVSIGVDCWMAEFLRKHHLRTLSFPFDWAVSYNGVSRCIEEKFKYFIQLKDRINPYDVYFHHDFQHGHLYRQDKEKYERRCLRFLKLLEGEEEVIFCRKGHAVHHHSEHKYETITSDLDDALRLDQILKEKYPRLRYRIIVILVCDKCFDPTKDYSSDKMDVHNIVGQDPSRFETLCKELFQVS